MTIFETVDDVVYRLAGGCPVAGRTRRPMEDGPSSQLLNLLLQRERQLVSQQPFPHRLPQGEGVIGWAERNREASWICAAARRLGLGLDSAALAVALLDRVVAKTRVPSKYINCVAAASLSIARKICEDGDEEASIFLGRLRLEYSESELKRMEIRILDVLEWDANLPNVNRFVETLLSHLGAAFLLDIIRPHIEALLGESSLSAKFRPSLLALSVVTLFIEATNRHWQQAASALAKACQVESAELLRCRNCVASLWSRQLLPKLSAFDLLRPQIEESDDDEKSCERDQYSCLAQTPTACPPPPSTPDIASPRALQATPC